MISSQSLDIVGFQEVRFEAGDDTNNQIGQLAEFFPDYQVTNDTSASLGYKNGHKSYVMCKFIMPISLCVHPFSPFFCFLSSISVCAFLFCSVCAFSLLFWVV